MAELIPNADTATWVADCLDGLADILPGFLPAPPISDRDFWTALPDATSATLLTDAEAILGTDWPVLSAGAYRAFTRTGDRSFYESRYFDRRRRLNALVLAELVEARGRFVDDLIDGLLLVCEESGWQLPAHNCRVRDGVHDPLPDPDRPIIDLFAAETGAQLAVISALLGEVLDAQSPMIVDRITREIDRRITRPYLERHFWWMGNGQEKMNNWTAWCTENILVSTFVRSTSQATRHAVLTKAAHSLDAFLKDYGEDGACDEGALYYRHAALSLSGALAVMHSVSPNAFAPLWDQPKLKNMAEYLVHAHVEDGWYVNFADASAVLPPCGAREFRFGTQVGSAALCALAATDAKADPRPDQPDEINLAYRLLALTSAAEMADFAAPLAVPDIYYPSCGVFIARDGRFLVAAKAGDNDDGHNHNDVGSVTIFKQGKPLLIDVGVETYTKKTFSPERYDIWTMQSAFHNLPTFAGSGQRAGPAFAARDVVVELGEMVSQIAMDIAGAYPGEAGLSSYRRRVRLIKGEAVEIADLYEGTRPAELSLMFCDRPNLCDGRIRIGTLAEIELSGAGTMRIEEIPVTDPRLLWAWPDRIYRVLVPIDGRALRLRIT